MLIFTYQIKATMTKIKKISTTDKVAVFTMGSPGAGKSYIANKYFAGIKRLDCDAIKAEHKDYDPKNPSLVHRWSSNEMKKRVANHFNNSEESIVVDGTGANAEKLIIWMEQAMENGFKTQLVYVTVSMKTALARNAARERTIDSELLISKYKEVKFSFDIVAPHADIINVIQNN